MGRGKNMGKPLATWKDFLQKSRTGGSASYVSVEGDVLYTVFDFQGLSPQSSPSNSRMMFFFLFLSFQNIMLVLLRKWSL